MSPVLLVGYFTLFILVAVALVFGGLLLGRFLRPDNPTPIKRETYECGEPSVGSADIQFDIRFYVVAMVFLIFDVEVALFFPWATVFGKATHLASATINVESRHERLIELGVGKKLDSASTPETTSMGDIGTTNLSSYEDSGSCGSLASIRAWGRQLAKMAVCDILVFFGILMVGFAYVWSKGDLTWVRAIPPPSSPGIEGVGSPEGSTSAT